MYRQELGPKDPTRIALSLKVTFTFLFFSFHSILTIEVKPQTPGLSATLPSNPLLTEGSKNASNDDTITKPALLSDHFLNKQFILCEAIRNNEMRLNDWEVIHASDEFSLWRKKLEGKTSYEYIARGLFEDISVVVYNFTMHDLSFRKKWDQNIAEVRTLDSYSIINEEEKGGFEAMDLRPKEAHNTPNHPPTHNCQNLHCNTFNGLEDKPTNVVENSFSFSTKIDDRSFDLTQIFKMIVSFILRPFYHFMDIFQPLENHKYRYDFNEHMDINIPSNPTQSLIKESKGKRNNKSIEEIIYWAFKLPWPLQGRDFVYIRRIEFFPSDNAIVCVQEATTHPNCPIYKKYTRIEEYRSTLSLYPTNHHKSIYDDGLEYILYHYDDSRVPLPDWVTTYVTATIIPNTMKALYEATKKFETEIKLLINSSIEQKENNSENQENLPTSLLYDNQEHLPIRKPYERIIHNIIKNCNFNLKCQQRLSPDLCRDDPFKPPPLIHYPPENSLQAHIPKLLLQSSFVNRKQTLLEEKNFFDDNFTEIFFLGYCPVSGQHLYTAFPWLVFFNFNTPDT